MTPRMRSNLPQNSAILNLFQDLFTRKVTFQVISNLNLNMNKKSLTAFSLIEISIVILIVGILASGVILASQILETSRINVARSVTQSSEVAGIKNLALWLETTSDKSFSNFDSINNGDEISTWYDINPSASSKSNATQSSATRKPLFYSNSINGLPALKFDGVDDVLNVSGLYLNTSFPEINNNFSLFIVALATSTITVRAEGNTGVGGTSSQLYLLGSRHGDANYGVSLNTGGAGISFGTNGITFYEHASNYMPPILSYTVSKTVPVIIDMEYNSGTPSLYLNGSFIRTGLTGSKTYIFPPYQIGGGQYGFFQGYIGEVIVYSRKIKAEERDAVNNYLKKKWNIN